MDIDALYHLYIAFIQLKNAYDLQILELATGYVRKRKWLKMNYRYYFTCFITNSSSNIADWHGIQWYSPWEWSWVSKRCLIRGFVGTNARGYAVKTLCPEGGKNNPYGRCAGFLGEICNVNGPELIVCAAECARRREQANYIYTQIPSPLLVQGYPLSSIWTPTRVLNWGEDQRIFVRSLVGPTAGEDFEVSKPYHTRKRHRKRVDPAEIL